MATCYMLDDSGPRPPPRFLRPPTSVAYEEKPVPLVPDVSLIFSPSGSGVNVNSVTPRSTDSPLTPPIQASYQYHKNMNTGYEHGVGSDDRDRFRYAQPPPALGYHRGNVPENYPQGNARPRYSSADEGKTWNSCPAPAPPESLSTRLLQELMSLVKRQGEVIERMDEQLRHLVASQQPIRTRGIDEGVQTEDRTPTPVSTKRSSDGEQKRTEYQQQQKPSRNSTSASSSSSGHSTPCDSSSGRSSRENTPQTSAETKRSASTTRSTFKHKERSSSDDNKENKNKRNEKAAVPIPCSRPLEPPDNDNTQDLSTILRDLQLPTIKEQSIYSADNSIRRIDFDSINTSQMESPGVGRRASLFDCSSSDDSDDEDSEEVVQPTATFYRNVIGNVNRFLGTDDNKPASPPLRSARRHKHKHKASNYDFDHGGGNGSPKSHPGPTDTTIYGMTSSNLSFATRQYLQRHGLVSSQNGGNPKVDGGGGQAAFCPGPSNNAYAPKYPSNRILDMTALKNQPKLL